MVTKPKQVYERFGGLTYHDYQDKLVEETIQNEPPEIYESFTTDRSYCYGADLYIVIHADEINRTFNRRGDLPFQSCGKN